MQNIAKLLRAPEIGAAKVNQCRAALRAKLTELEAGARRLDDIAAEKAPDAMDDSAFANDRDIAVERLVQITSLLASVRSALDRMADGSYGVCTDCGEAISPKRLAVLPWAAYCRPCQQTLDVLRDISNEHIRASVMILN
jgi:DnaK suppressor protein